MGCALSASWTSSAEPARRPDREAPARP